VAGGIAWLIVARRRRSSDASGETDASTETDASATDPGEDGPGTGNV
jgi:hypothetical protein